eukprot:sb/3468053/
MVTRITVCTTFQRVNLERSCSQKLMKLVGGKGGPLTPFAAAGYSHELSFSPLVPQSLIFRAASHLKFLPAIDVYKKLLSTKFQLPSSSGSGVMACQKVPKWAKSIHFLYIRCEQAGCVGGGFRGMDGATFALASAVIVILICFMPVIVVREHDAPVDRSSTNDLNRSTNELEMDGLNGSNNRLDLPHPDALPTLKEVLGCLVRLCFGRKGRVRTQHVLGDLCFHYWAVVRTNPATVLGTKKYWLALQNQCQIIFGSAGLKDAQIVQRTCSEKGP